MGVGLRFIHTGDLHLDSPFQGIAQTAPEHVVSTLRDATLRSWDRIVGLAIDEQVDAVLVAGDVFEGANRTLRGQVAFRDGLARLANQRIPSFVVTGNHDPLSGWEPAVAWPELAWRFGATEVAARPILRDGLEIAQVHGISYAVRDVTRNLASTFRRGPDDRFAIGLLHANVGGIEGYANYAPCSMSDLLASGMDYWALGHIHKHGDPAGGRANGRLLRQSPGPGSRRSRSAWLLHRRGRLDGHGPSRVPGDGRGPLATDHGRDRRDRRRG